MSGPSNHKKGKSPQHQLHSTQCRAGKCPGSKVLRGHLSWSKHIDINTKKANQMLGFLKRKIRAHNKDLKSVAYKTFVRPQLGYASTVWYPHITTDINKVEAVQRRAARWATRDYRYTSSLTAMLKELN